MGFSTQQKTEDVPTQEKVFIRDLSDNKLFPEIQVKDLTKYLRPETVGCWDFDTPVYKMASNLENKYIKVVCKSDKTITGEMKGVKVFKGLGKKISESSWLGLLNVDRELAGLPTLLPEDFDVTEHQKLKMEEEKAFDQAKIMIYQNIKKIKLQYGITNVKLVMGSGDTFRNKLPTCRAYKGNRKETLRPLLLKKLRAWVLEELDAELAVPRADGENIEADDKIEYFGFEGYQHYRKHGWFSYVVLSSDKDSFNSAKYLIDPDTHSGKDNPLKGTFKYPQAMLIQATDKCAGGLSLVAKSGSKEVKGYGFKFLMYQAALGKDGADNYDALSHLGQGLDFGSLSAYKVLKPCTTAKEALQVTINTFAELLPYGVQYETFDGIEKDVPTLEYMNTYFLVAYMTRSATDGMDFYKLCSAFKVDTSAIEDNNKLTPPKRTFISDGKAVEDMVVFDHDVLLKLLATQLKGYKSLKKGDLVERLDDIKDCLTDLTDNFEAFYELKQEVKVFDKNS